MHVRALCFTVLMLVAGGPGRAAAGPPDPTITSGPASPTSQISAAFVFSESDAGATLACDLDGAGFTACDSSTGHGYPGPLAAGAHAFSLKAVDTSGGESAVVSFYWTIDPTAPQITFTGVPVDGSSATSASFGFFADEPSAFTCQLDGQAGEPCQPDPGDPGNAAKGTQAYGGLGEGAHTFTVTGTDAAGNVAALGFSWTIDLTAPTLGITGAPPDPTPSNTASFRFQSGEASAFGCQLDAATPGMAGPCDPDPDDPGNPARGAKSYTGLSEGLYTFTVTATDGAGNAAAQAFSWLIDAQPAKRGIRHPDPRSDAAGWNNTDVVDPVHDRGHRRRSGRRRQHRQPAGALRRSLGRHRDRHGDRSRGQHRLGHLARREDRQDATRRDDRRTRRRRALPHRPRRHRRLLLRR